ncbi:hypothetical protein DY000_02060287 [Brassica cretica]|uniref:Uncharacterized protein n=1 Tax=Brassica cretica TaxID=69181 RepID=A0ABQ7ASC8_BRACR|nr:hypothetical protein DY000_02060287 [Brassica cretica]
MALFIMKWMDLSLKECRMQGSSFLRASPQDPVSAPRASASEIELDAIIGEGRLVDPSCFTSSLEFVSASLGSRELDSSRDFCFAFGRSIFNLERELKCTDRKMENSGAPRDSPWLDRVTSVKLK